MASPLREWTEGDWEMLLNHIETGRVIPIVGRDLLRVKLPGEAQEILLQSYIARRLLEIYGLITPGAATAPNLNDAVCLCLARRVLPLEIPYTVRKILQELQAKSHDIPAPLRHLAEITDFRLYVSTTFDSLMQRAIEQTMLGGQARAPRIFSFDPKPSTGRRVEDLPPLNARQDGRPSIYHLMGHLDADARRFDPGNVVLSDEDLLEFICALLSENRERVPVNLLNELSSNHLLLLGCNFTDWLARFFLRATRRNHLLSAPGDYTSGPTIQYVVDDMTLQDTNLVLFVEQFWPNTRVYRTQDVVDFLQELNTRWRARNEDKLTEQTEALPGVSAALGEEPDNSRIFVSYAREDEQAARKICEGLRELGVWLDQAELNPGVNWDDSIQRSLEKCRVFLPVISRSSNTRREGYFFKEWRMASERSQFMPNDARFIWPVVIDDSKQVSARVPREFLKAQWTNLPGGGVTGDFFLQLKGYLSSEG